MNTWVWTNMGLDGHRLSAINHCNGARYGIDWLPAMSPDLLTWQQFGHWTSAKDISCIKKWHLYCFEN